MDKKVKCNECENDADIIGKYSGAPEVNFCLKHFQKKLKEKFPDEKLMEELKKKQWFNHKE